MHDAGFCAGGDVCADDLAVFDQKRCVIHAAFVRVVCDPVDVARQLLAAVLQQIVALRDLKLVVAQEDLAGVSRDGDLLGLDRLRLDLPAVALEEGDARLVRCALRACFRGLFRFAARAAQPRYRSS